MREKLEKNDRMIKGQCDGEKKTDREIEGWGGGGGETNTTAQLLHHTCRDLCVNITW